MRSNATATENRPSPAINGPICIPKISKITAIPMTHTINLAALSNHNCIAIVNQDLADNAAKMVLCYLIKH